MQSTIQYLSEMSLLDLSELLVIKTTTFLRLLEQKEVNGLEIRNLGFEVSEMQKAIVEKRSNNLKKHSRDRVLLHVKTYF